ncbi:hypothetical protein LX32DRAFT_727418 [Colletotrichum zoysiae]|uniref:Uncharacterized protein n=1 Tax=Colletotrichum zoysiae TaxID=1216348 RepID=A0AAD9HM42_9PEZI|nr:hypothetical protein LX32DRAFT_727418 [Colletotrichum zoysiae]
MRLCPFLHLFLVSSAAAAATVSIRGGAVTSTAELPPDVHAPVSPRSSPKPNTIPLVGDVLCRKEPDSPGHPEIGATAQYRAAQEFCVDGGRLARDARFRYRDADGANHDFRVSWRAGCRVNLPSQSLRFPLGKEGRWKEPLGCLKLLGRVFGASAAEAAAPNEPAPGVHAGDSGVHQTPLGSDQHVQPQNTDTHDMAAAADRSVGGGNAGTTGQQEHHHDDQQQKHQKHQKGAVSAVVDTVVNKALGFGGASKAEKRRSLGAA